MTSDNLLGDIYEECIPLFIALGDRTRLTILQCLFETQTTGESRIPGLNVNEITDRTSLSRPAAVREDRAVCGGVRDQWKDHGISGIF